MHSFKEGCLGRSPFHESYKVVEFKDAKNSSFCLICIEMYHFSPGWEAEGGEGVRSDGAIFITKSRKRRVLLYRGSSYIFV